jgi:hypothetical protein
VKDISLEDILSNLLFIGIESEIQREGMYLEEKEMGLSDKMRCDGWGLDGNVK